MHPRKSLTKRIGPYLLPLRVRHLHGPRQPEIGPREVIVLSLARNAGRHVATFIEHHLALGARHIVLLDNGSRDDTVDIARRYERVTVLRTRASFRYHEYIMRRYLIHRFARGRWCLYADIDELFDYPASDRLPLDGFLGYLSHHGYTAVVAHMLDMFADRPLAPPQRSEGDLRTAYPLYDPGNLTREPFPDDRNERGTAPVQQLYGGIRQSFLGVNVLLTKHPLLFNDGVIEPFTGRHAVAHSVSNARVADISCLLRHYKLIDGLYEQAQDVAAAENYGDNDTRDYKHYLHSLQSAQNNRNPASAAMHPQAFSDVDALVEHGILQVSEAYRDWVAGRAGGASSGTQ